MKDGFSITGKIECYNCKERRPLKPMEYLMMKNLPCYKCNQRLKVVGRRVDSKGLYFQTEPEDLSLDY